MDIRELNLELLNHVSGGNQEEAEKYIQSLYEKYGISTYDELMATWTGEERSKYLAILMDWD